MIDLAIALGESLSAVFSNRPSAATNDGYSQLLSRGCQGSFVKFREASLWMVQGYKLGFSRKPVPTAVGVFSAAISRVRSFSRKAAKYFSSTYVRKYCSGYRCHIFSLGLCSRLSYMVLKFYEHYILNLYGKRRGELYSNARLGTAKKLLWLFSTFKLVPSVAYFGSTSLVRRPPSSVS